MTVSARSTSKRCSERRRYESQTSLRSCGRRVQHGAKVWHTFASTGRGGLLPRPVSFSIRRGHRIPALERRLRCAWSRRDAQRRSANAPTGQWHEVTLTLPLAFSFQSRAAWIRPAIGHHGWSSESAPPLCTGGFEDMARAQARPSDQKVKSEAAAALTRCGGRIRSRPKEQNYRFDPRRAGSRRQADSIPGFSRRGNSRRLNVGFTCGEGATALGCIALALQSLRVPGWPAGRVGCAQTRSISTFRRAMFEARFT
jgi:hypothetical protein